MNTNFKRKHILVIDDESQTVELLKEFLTEKGYDVSYALTGKEGKHAALTTRPDLIVLDLYLPDTKGSDLTQELRKNSVTANIPIILCTAYQITTEEKMKGFRSGVDDFMIRPFKLVELEARIEAVLRRAIKTNDIESHLKDLIKTPAAPASVQAPAPTPAPEPVETNYPDPVGTSFREMPAPVLKKSTHSKTHPVSHNLFKRFLQLLQRPQEIFKDLDEHHDFLLAIVLVLGTPFVAGLSRLAIKNTGFDLWMGFVSLGVISNIIMWFGIAGVLHLVIPFYGMNLPMKHALIFSGLGWAPRLIGALLTALYPHLLSGFMAENSQFTAGIDLIPGLYTASWAEYLSSFGLFDVWAAWITLNGLWITCNQGKKQWGTVSIVVGTACLLIGGFTKY